MNTNDFTEEYNAIFERALIISIITRSMGMVWVANLLDEEKYNQRDVFEYGMRLAKDGKTPDLIDKILTNIIDLETDNEKKLLKNIQKDAALSIQKGVNTDDLVLILNSYVNINLDAAKKKHTEIEKRISNVVVKEFYVAQEKNNELHERVSKEIADVFNKK